jgi:hypothetical protein
MIDFSNTDANLQNFFSAEGNIREKAGNVAVWSAAVSSSTSRSRLNYADAAAGLRHSRVPVMAQVSSYAPLVNRIPAPYSSCRGRKS